MKKFTLLLMLVSMLSSCALYEYKSIPMVNVKIGMSKNEAIQALGKKPDNLIGAKQYKNGTVEVLQYSRYYLNGALRERYWLYFFNDKLVQWGRPGDWQKEADKVYEIRSGQNLNLKQEHLNEL